MAQNLSSLYPPGLAGYIGGQQLGQQGTLNNVGLLSSLLRAQAQQTQQDELARRAGQEREFRSGFRPDMTQEELTAHASRFAQPADVLRTQQASLDRQNALRMKAAELVQQHQFRLDEIKQKSTDAAATARELLAEKQAFQMQMREFMVQNRQPVAPTVTEVADPADPTKSIKIDARTGAKIGDAPLKPKVERAVPSPLQKQLTEGAELADATQRFATTFKNDFAGKTITGELGNTYGKIMGDNTGQTQWWQDYELHQSQIRNKLFGSALTAPEIEAWNKSAINPRMDAAQVRANLTRRNILEQRGIDRIIKGAIAGGYNKEQIEAFTGRATTPSASPQQPQQPQDPLGIR